MYTEFYKLNDLPFRLSPDRRFFFGSESHKKAVSYLLYGVHQNEGFVVVTGDVGTGKTTLVEYLLDQLDRRKHEVANVVTSQLDPTMMLGVVSNAFGIQLEDGGKARLLGAIERHLRNLHGQGKLPILIIDEAQNLPLQSLEELRMLSNFSFDHKMALQVILLGQPEFRHIIARPELEQLRQRIIASHHLTPLSAKDTRGYVEHRLSTVGWRGDPEFEDEAFQEIFEITGGLPREVNRLCSRILIFGGLEETHRITVAMVREIGEELRDELPPRSEAPNFYPANDLAGIDSRLRSLESEMMMHRRIVRRALELAGRFVETRLGRAASCGTSRKQVKAGGNADVIPPDHAR